MKTFLTILFLLFISISLSQTAQRKWKGEFDFGSGFCMTTFLNVNKTNGETLITSPKNADVRLFGSFKAKLGRLFGKSPKKGIFLTIESKQKGDSLFGNAKLPMLGELKFKGILNEKVLSGEFIKNNTKIGRLTTVKTNEESIDYTSFYPKILKITQNNIYSKKVLQSKEWKQFKKELDDLCNNAKDDIELFLGFNLLTPKLPFTHYSLFINEKEDERENNSNELDKKEPTVVFEEMTIKTAYLKIKNFSTSKEQLATVLPKIVENKKYKNLIIDLRGNGGGGIEAASEFSKYFINDFIKVGYFTTNRLQYSGFERNLFETLPETSPETTYEFIKELKSGRGAKLVFQKNENPVFSGQIFVLTDNKTASTCEPIVYVLKKSKRATIVGEKTAGAMLSAASFDISGKYKLIIPIADFYTYDGVRLDQVGVTPDIEITSSKSLNKVMELISSKN